MKCSGRIWSCGEIKFRRQQDADLLSNLISSDPGNRHQVEWTRETRQSIGGRGEPTTIIQWNELNRWRPTIMVWLLWSDFLSVPHDIFNQLQGTDYCAYLLTTNAHNTINSSVAYYNILIYSSEWSLVWSQLVCIYVNAHWECNHSPSKRMNGSKDSTNLVINLEKVRFQDNNRYVSRWIHRPTRGRH